MKEKVGCGNLPQLAEFVRLATPLARFGKVDRTASKQGVASSSLAGRATAFDLIEAEGIREIGRHPRSTAKKADGRVLGEIQGHVALLVFFSIP